MCTLVSGQLFTFVLCVTTLLNSSAGLIFVMFVILFNKGFPVSLTAVIFMITQFTVVQSWPPTFGNFLSSLMTFICPWWQHVFVKTILFSDRSCQRKDDKRRCCTLITTGYPVNDQTSITVSCFNWPTDAFICGTVPLESRTGWGVVVFSVILK